MSLFPNSHWPFGRQVLTVAFFSVLILQLPAQNVCDEGQCSEEILKIELPVPLNADTQDKDRTDLFKKAYLRAKSLESEYPQDEDFKRMYRDGEVTGKQCMWHYYLKGAFAYEYEQNPDFKEFIDQQEPDIAKFKRVGFETSTHALSMMNRMRQNCPRELRKLEKLGGPSLEDLPKVFRKLAEVQGYFDADGNNLKPILKPGVAELLDLVADLDLEESLGDQLNSLTDEVKDAKSGISQAKEKNESSQQKMTMLLPAGKMLAPNSKASNKMGGLQPSLAASQSALNGLDENLDELASELEAFNAEYPGLVKEKEELVNTLSVPGLHYEQAKEMVDNFMKKYEDFNQQLEEKQLTKEEAVAKLEELTEEQEKIAEEIKVVEEAVEVAKVEAEKSKGLEETIGKLKEKLNDLNEDEVWQQEVDDCKEQLSKAETTIEEETESGKERRNNLNRTIAKGVKLHGKLGEVKDVLDDLRKGEALTTESMDEFLALLKRRKQIEIEVVDRNKEQKKVAGNIQALNDNLSGLKGDVDKKRLDLDEIQQELNGLAASKSGFEQDLDEPETDSTGLELLFSDLRNKYDDLAAKEKCPGTEDVQNQLDNILEEFKQVAEKMQEFADKQEELDEAGDQLENDTKQMVARLEEAKRKVEELAGIEAEMEEEYNTDLELRPVSIEEWSESFQVDRTYWQATFHPDREVVDGFVGKYFEVQLKDAAKSVRLLFGAGEYSMEKTAFRKSYGATIGAFAAEALHMLKAEEADKVMLFIQGSADIAGDATFTGDLDEQFKFTEVDVLPQKEELENFYNQAEKRTIPEMGFRNEHLPNLRGQYLKNMITVYSKKFDPVLLEGSVKDYADIQERNAVIYLFFPEEILKE